MDLNDYENVALRREMTNAGCRSIVVGDRPHFECPGQDAQNIATLAFQHLWNLNNPDEPLAEDGFCGEGTKHALGRSPANGFPIGGCRGALVAGTEACNERDDDFDGQIDEGLDCSGTCVAEAVDGAEDALFKDLPPGQFGFEEAALLRRAGITTGCQPNPLMFCPRCLTTRAQMVTFVVRALGVDLAPYRAGRTFEDVSPMSTYHPYIEAAADLGITIGCGPTTFCPDDFVTRGEAATFIVRALDWPRVEGVQFFQDVPLGYTHQSAIETLRTYCVTNGCNAENFCPEAELNRAQAAAFIARAWNLENNNQCLIEHCNGQDEDLDGRADEAANACTCEATVPDEVCGNDADEDCDGRVDEDCVEQDMAPVVLPADAGMSTGRTDMSLPSHARWTPRGAAIPAQTDLG